MFNDLGHPFMVCGCCGSEFHAEHSCFIKQGVPPEAKLQAEVHREVSRLHELHKTGRFDKIKTETSLRWLVTMRRRVLAKTAAAARA